MISRMKFQEGRVKAQTPSILHLDPPVPLKEVLRVTM